MARRPRIELPPEPGHPPQPRANPRLFGHGAAEAAFVGSLRAGRMHHAWLLAGPPGIGKLTLAFRLARHLLVPRPEDSADPAFRRIASGTHADLLLLEREVSGSTGKMRREIAVDQVREIVSFMHLTPAEAGWRVVLVDAAEEMNRNAANALLKVLEEPPARAILLLTSDAPGRLLPTIRSRCRRLMLDALPPEPMDAALRWLLPDEDDAARAKLAAIADGAPGRAMTLSGEGALALAALADDVLAARTLPVARMHEVADRATKGEEGFETFMALLRAGVSARVRGAARAGQGGAMGGRPLADWFEVWHALGRLQDETTRFSLDKRTAVIAGLELLTTA